MASSFPTPKSPPDNAHFYGKRQQMVKVQALEREIAILEEELKSLDGVPLASSCCKEIDDFVEATTDPLVEINPDVARSNCFHKRPRQKFPSKFPWICCFCCPIVGVGTSPCCDCCCRTDACHWSCLRCSSCLKCCYQKLLCSCSLSRSCFPCAKLKLCCGCAKSCSASCFLCR